MNDHNPEARVKTCLDTPNDQNQKDQPAADRQHSLLNIHQNPVDNQNFESKKSKTNILRARKIGAAALAVAVLASGYIGNKYSGDPLLLPKIAVEYLISKDTIASVPKDQMQKIEAILNRPENPQINKLINDAENKTQRQFRDSFYNLCRKQAKKYGFDIPNMAWYAKKIDNAKDADSVISTVNQLTQKYGFSVDYLRATGLKELGLGIKTVDWHNLNVPKVKKIASHIIDGLSTIPTEVGEYAPIKHIWLVKSLKPRSFSGDLNGIAPVLTGNIYIELDNLDESVLRHEIGHFIDYKMGGLYGMMHDPQFEKLNPPGFKYGKNDLIGAYGLFRPVLDEYSTTSVSEDKATFYNMILAGMPPAVYSTHYPIIRRKAITLLARLNQRLPKIADYFDSISDKE